MGGNDQISCLLACCLTLDPNTQIIERAWRFARLKIIKCANNYDIQTLCWATWQNCGGALSVHASEPFNDFLREVARLCPRQLQMTLFFSAQTMLIFIITFTCFYKSIPCFKTKYRVSCNDARC